MIDWARRGLEAFEKTPPKTMADILASLNLRPEPDGAVPLASAVAIGKATAAEVLARVEPAKKKGAPKGSQNAAKDREIKGYNVTFQESQCFLQGRRPIATAHPFASCNLRRLANTRSSLQ